MKTRIEKWQVEEFMELWTEMKEESEGTGRKQPKVQEESLQATNARRARRAVADGQYKKAM